MSSFLWLLLYLAPLLGITAALFAWFGWQWRGSDMQQRINELTAQIDTAQTALQRAEADQAAIPAEAPGPQGLSADEVEALQGALKSAQAETRLRQDDAVKAREAAQALETEKDRLLADLEQLRAELAASQAKCANAEAELVTLHNAPSLVEAAAEGTAPAKAKRKRSTPAKPKAAAAAAPATLREKISALEAQQVTHEAGLSTLTQERDGWQQRISQLEEESPADPAGLALARRSLTDSDKRLKATTLEIERLQNQTRVLLRIEEAAAALSGVPDDDLTQIKGIKKIISEQLRAHGIRTWRQIALWDEAELRAFSELLAFKSRATREQWQEQARTLHEAAHGLLI